MKTATKTFLIIILLLFTLNLLSQEPAYLQKFADIPLSFTINKGQHNPEVAFTSKGNGCSMFFTSKGTTFLLNHKTKKLVENQKSDINEINDNEIISYSLKLNFVQSNLNPEILGEEVLESKTNYLTGNDKSQWHINILNYRKIRLKNLYEGIDLLYYGNQNKLEYDFIVKPGEDPSKIKLWYDLGKTKPNAIAVNEIGELVITTPLGEITEHKLYCYQIKDGKKVEIEGNYRIIDEKKTTFCFKLGEYNKNLELVIDPVIEYSSYFGGNGSDWCYGIARDAQGNIYMGGNTDSQDFPTSAGAVNTKSKGSQESFITKLDPTCTKVIYSTYIGGSGEDFAGGVAIDSYGNAYITGNTNSRNIPVTANALYKTYQGPVNALHGDIFIVKLSASGDSFIYSTYFGASGIDVSGNIFADSIGNAYISGRTSSSDFPVSANAFGKKYNGKEDGFVLKLDPDGRLIYSSYLGGTQDDDAVCITADKYGNAIVSSSTNSSDFPVSSKAYDKTYHGGGDIYVTKINEDGSNILFSTFLGGKNGDVPMKISLDKTENIYITGSTESTDFPESNRIESLRGKRDVFIAKLSSSGDKLLYSAVFGGNLNDEGTSVAIDSKGNLFVAGSTLSNDFPVTSNAFDQTYNGGTSSFGRGGDVFVAFIDMSKPKLKYSTFYGGKDNEYYTDLVIDNDKIILSGITSSNDFPVTNNAFGKTRKGTEDIFIVKMDINAAINNNAPVFKNPLKDTIIETGKSFNYQFPDKQQLDTDEMDKLEYTVTLKDGSSLPAWLKFNKVSNTLRGTPSDAGTLDIILQVTDNHKDTAYDEFRITIKEPNKTGINNFKKNDEIMITPNPSNGLFTISFGTTPSRNSTVEIYNTKGSLVLTKTGHNKSNITTDLTGNPKGMYIIKVIKDELTYKEKIILE